MTFNWQKVATSTVIVISGIVIFMVSLLIIALLLVGTERGTRMTLNIAQQFSPGELIIEHQSGHLLGELKLARAQFNQENLSIGASDIVLKWRPRKLIGQTLYVDHFTFSSLDVVTTTDDTADDDSSDKVELPEISLPIEIVLKDVVLNNITLQLGELNQHIERVELSAHSIHDQHHIERLLVNVEQSEVRAQGDIHTHGKYAMDLSVEALVELPELHSLEVQLALQGDMENLDVNLTTSGLASTNVEAQVYHLLDLEQLSWDASIKLDGIRHQLVAEHVSEMDVALRSRGNLTSLEVDLEGLLNTSEQGMVELDVALSWHDRKLDIKQFEMTAEEMISELIVTGSAVFGDVLDINIEGNAHAFGFTQNQFKLTASGDQRGAERLNLELQLPQGEAQIQGSLYWDPHLSWDLDIGVNQVDFTQINELLHGGLALTLHTHGSFDDELVLFADIQELNGQLLDYTIWGEGEVRITGDHYQADELNIVWGDAQISADGHYSPDGISLNFLLNIPQISSFLPQAHGELAAQGEVRGDEESPRLNITVEGHDLHWQTYRIERIQAQLEADGTFQRLPIGDIEATNLEIDQQQFERIAIQLQQHDQHHIDAEVDLADIELRLTLVGDWLLDELLWDGEIQRLQIRNPDFGRWNLSQQAQLRVSPETAHLDDFCLIITTRESEVCANLSWQSETDDLALDLRAENIPYQLFAQWIPEDIQVLGEFSLFADVNQAEGELNSDIRLAISDTSVRVPAQELRVDFDSGDLIRIRGDQNELNAELRLLSEQLEGGIEAQASIYDILEEQRTLRGELGVDVRSFVLMSVLIPDIQDVRGTLNGRIDFEGPPDSLTIGGGLEFSDGFAEIPATGLELRNLNLTVRAPETNEAPFTLVGDVDAGEGQLHIEGEYYLREQRARLNIEGAAFPALNTRELEVTIAPNLQIEYTPDLLRLRGEVNVPRARITPPDFETVDSVSSDTVLVGGDGGPYDQSLGTIPIDMDVTVNLGNDVQVSAFGFEGRLEGGLRIIEQTGQETTAVGNIDVASGAYEIYGQALNIERGRLIFTGGPITNPGLDLRVERNIEMQSITVGARVGGTLENPTLNLFSTPTMQDSAILSYLIFGRGPGQGNTGEENMLAQATLALGMSGGNRLGERLSDTLGVDEITLDSGDTFESTALYIGKQISSRLYIKYGVGLVEPVSTFFIRYRLTDNLNFESRTGNEQSGADIFYTIER